MIAQGEGKTASSPAGTLTEPALKRFGSFNGSAQRNAPMLGKPPRSATWSLPRDSYGAALVTP